MPGQPRRRLVLVLLLLSAGAAGAAGYALATRTKSGAPAAGGEPSGTGTVIGGTPSPGPSGRPEAPGRAGVFSISGRVDGLVPGRPATLPLTVTNPNPWPIEIRTLDIGVEPAGNGCPASLLEVGRYAFTGGQSFAAPARGTVVVPVPVRLADSPAHDQSACATFPLTFTGTAERMVGR